MNKTEKLVKIAREKNIATKKDLYLLAVELDFTGIVFAKAQKILDLPSAFDLKSDEEKKVSIFWNEWKKLKGYRSFIFCNKNTKNTAVKSELNNVENYEEITAKELQKLAKEILNGEENIGKYKEFIQKVASGEYL